MELLLAGMEKTFRGVGFVEATLDSEMLSLRCLLGGYTELAVVYIRWSGLDIELVV